MHGSFSLAFSHEGYGKDNSYGSSPAPAYGKDTKDNYGNRRSKDAKSDTPANVAPPVGQGKT